jgi:hypothetical protein
MESRQLLTDEVELVPNSNGQCQITTHLDALDTSGGKTSIATGTMFSVKALETIEILSFEFSHYPVDANLGVEIYMLPGKHYLAQRTTPLAWTLVSTTIATPAPDQGDDWKISPRADMKPSVSLTMQKGESSSFYFSLKSQHLKLLDFTSSLIYQQDSNLQIDTGIGISQRNFPTNTDNDVNSLAFQGRIHYRAFADCNNLLETTTLQVPFVVDATVVMKDVSIYQSAFVNLFQEDPTLSRWKNSQGLAITAFDITPGEKRGTTFSKEHIVNPTTTPNITLF